MIIIVAFATLLSYKWIDMQLSAQETSPIKVAEISLLKFR